MPARPDWVVLGTPLTDGRVAVYASKTLTHAELEREVDHEYLYLLRDPYLRSAPERMTLTVGLTSFTVTYADTYEEALQILFNTWSASGGAARDAPAAAALPAAVQPHLP